MEPVTAFAWNGRQIPSGINGNRGMVCINLSQGKNIIATFNWDPFLLQAAPRITSLKKPPKIFLRHRLVGPSKRFINSYIKFQPNNVCLPK